MKINSRRNTLLGTAAAALLYSALASPVAAQDVVAPFPVTPELIDSLNSKDAVWPDDPAVPDLPPLTNTDDLPPPDDNFLHTHYWDGLHTPDKLPPLPLSPQVDLDEPLKIDVIWSMRSPYSYLVLQRLVYLNSNYNVDVTVRPVMPIAVRSTEGGSGSAGGAFGIWYKLQDAMWDTVRSAHFNGVPFKWPTPDPIWQNIYPQGGELFGYVHPPEKQPYISWLVRLCAYAQMKGKSLECVNQISYLVFGNQSEHWPAEVKERFNRIEGLDYDEAIKFIQESPEKVDAVWAENSKVQVEAGHGGVPLFIFQGEPFFGQDRFDQFVWRLRQSGLRQRHEPIAPLTPKPIRWPEAG